MSTRRTGALLVAIVVAMAPAWAAELEFQDPKGDDDGPGTYTYPTDRAYAPGSFDLTEFVIEDDGTTADLEVKVATSLDDPWETGAGFAVQMVFVFIDTDGVAGSGHADGLPGTNVTFAKGHEWDAAIILSPAPPARVNEEVRTKAAAMADDIIVPEKVTGSGKTITASVALADIGDGDPAGWGYQVVMQSNESYPSRTDLLTRKVNQFEGQHRFGGGTDTDCDPHAMDILAGAATGDASEIAAQHEMLSYACDDEGDAVERATLKMVRR